MPLRMYLNRNGDERRSKMLKTLTKAGKVEWGWNNVKVMFEYKATK